MLHNKAVEGKGTPLRKVINVQTRQQYDFFITGQLVVSSTENQIQAEISFCANVNKKLRPSTVNILI